jgi:glycosyltransferase involved in cell wall biosynthesis
MSKTTLMFESIQDDSVQKGHMRPLRVAILHWGFPPIIGGVETHLTLLGPALAAAGHQVILLTCAAEGVPMEETYAGMQIRRTTLMDLNWLAQRGFEGLADRIQEELHAFFDEVQPEIIHAHNMHYFSKLHAQALQQEATTRDVPLVLTAHNVWDDGEFLDLTLHIDWTHVIAVSNFIRQELIASGMPGNHVTTILHGIDHTQLARTAAESSAEEPRFHGRRIIFHPARMGLAKGNDVSVKAMRLIKKHVPEALLVMAGTKNIIDWSQSQQKDIGYILHLVQEYGLQDDVYVNFFSREEILRMYARSEICIYPSAFGEPFGLTMLEASAMSKPMIVTDSGGMPEVIQNGVNGYVIRVRDAHALADRCVQLLTDEPLRQQLGETGRRMVEERFTVQRMLDDHLAVYTQVLGEI